MQLRKQHKERILAQEKRILAQEKRDRQHAVDNAGNVTPAPSPPLALGEVRPIATYEPGEPDAPDEPNAPPAKRVKTEATGVEGDDIPPMPEDAYVKEEPADGGGIPPMPEDAYVKEEPVLDA